MLFSTFGCNKRQKVTHIDGFHQKRLALILPTALSTCIQTQKVSHTKGLHLVTPVAGIEPATTRLKAGRSTDWATRTALLKHAEILG
jgi:hypothetical protein